MKRIAVVTIIIATVFLSGCFQFKKISFTDKTNIDGGVKIDFSQNNNENKNSDSEFVFNVGKISYTEHKKSGVNAANDFGGQAQDNGAAYKSLLDFYNYVEDIKTESDESMEIFEIPGYTKEDISGAILKNRMILERVRKIVVPDDLIRTSEGRYYADKFANNYLETLILFRLKLLENMAKVTNKKNDDIEREINTLKGAVVPNKEAALKFAGESMMEEEGYFWNEELRKFEIKKQ